MPALLRIISSALPSFYSILMVYIHRSLVNIYADDTIFENLDEQMLAADFVSDLALTAKWWNNWLVIFNTSNTKLIPLSHYIQTLNFCL